MAKATYSPQNALQIKEMVIKKSWEKVTQFPDPQMMLKWKSWVTWYLQKTNSTFPFPPQVPPCAKALERRKNDSWKQQVSAQWNLPTFFFFFPCTHPSFLAFNALQFSRLHFDISTSWRDFYLLFLHSSNRLPVLANPGCFSVGIFELSEDEQCSAARTLLENGINQ